MKRMKSFFQKSGLLMMAMGMAFVSCSEDDNNGTEIPGQDEGKKPAAVVFEYTNVETADIIEYCDIVVEYNDGSGVKTETVTTTEWKKTFTTNLPCTYTFKKTVTLKAEKDMAAAEKISYIKNGHIYKYTIVDADGKSVNKTGGSSDVSTAASAGSKAAELIAQGRLDATTSFSFDSDGNSK